MPRQIDRILHPRDDFDRVDRLAFVVSGGGGTASPLFRDVAELVVRVLRGDHAGVRPALDVPNFSGGDLRKQDGFARGRLADRDHAPGRRFGSQRRRVRAGRQIGAFVRLAAAGTRDSRRCRRGEAGLPGCADQVPVFFERAGRIRRVRSPRRDASEPAEAADGRIPDAVVIPDLDRLLGSRDDVLARDAVDDVHRHRQARAPRSSRARVICGVLRARAVLDARPQTHTFVDQRQQVRLRLGEREEPVAAAACGGHVRPEHAGGALPEQVHQAHRRSRRARHAGHLNRLRESAPADIAPHEHAIVANIDDVGRAAAVDIGDEQAFRIMVAGQQRRRLHADAGVEAASAERRPGPRRLRSARAPNRAGRRRSCQRRTRRVPTT